MIHPGKGHAAQRCSSEILVNRGSYLPHERISPRSGPEGRALHAASNPPAAAAGSGRASGTLTSAAD